MATTVTTGGTARVETDDRAVLSYLDGLPSASEATSPFHQWAERRGDCNGVSFYDVSESAGREAQLLSFGA